MGKNLNKILSFSVGPIQNVISPKKNNNLGIQKDPMMKQSPTDFSISIPSLGVVDFTLYANPEELNWKFGDKTKDTSENTGGIVESNYPDDFDILQFSGTTGGFLHLQAGYEALKREGSESYIRFKDFLNLFKNNGDTYDAKGEILDAGIVALHFMGVYWWGKFTSFNYNEKEESPLQFTLDFEFKVSGTFLAT